MPLCAQNSASPDLDTPVPATVPATPEDKHIFGVLSNYRTADGSTPFAPINAKQKMTIAWNDTKDGPAYGIAAVFSGLYQLENQNPSFGQGLKGYAHRYGCSLIDQDFGNMMSEGVLPVLFHEDPRYFRRSTGSFRSRFFYAATRVLVTKSDSGRNTLNVAELLGNGMVGALGNVYYVDNRGLNDTVTRLFTQTATDAISNVLKEFWPDVKKHFAKKHSATDPE